MSDAYASIPCPECGRGHVQSWADKRFGCRRDRLPGVVVPFRPHYHKTLARGPNDPEAHVNSEYQLKKLIDKRRRQGWVQQHPGDLADAPKRLAERRAAARAKPLLSTEEIHKLAQGRTP